MDQAVGSGLVAHRTWLPPRRRERRLGRVAVISLWLHLTLLALILVTVDREQREEELPPPSTVAMVFEGGRPEGPTVPKSEIPLPTPTAPPAPPPAPAPAPPSAPPPRAAVEPPKPPAPTATVEPTPAPQPPPPPTPAPSLPLPPPPPPLAMVVPRPVPPPRPVQPPAVAPRPAAPQPTAPNKPSAFPTPMNFSYNPMQTAPSRPQARSASSRAPATLDFSLAPKQGALDNTPFSLVTGAKVGPDWRNELSAWVRAHAYYPEQAAMNGEDGDVMVQVVANPDGQVTSVELERKSGSMWLDLALQGMFRNAHLPPLHGENEPITFNFTMHYILIRVR